MLNIFISIAVIIILGFMIFLLGSSLVALSQYCNEMEDKINDNNTTNNNTTN